MQALCPEFPDEWDDGVGFFQRSDMHFSVPAHLWAVAELETRGWDWKQAQHSKTPVRRFTPRSRGLFRRFHTFSCKAGGDVLNARKRLWSPGGFHCRKCSSCPAVLSVCNFEKQVTYQDFKSLLLLLPGWIGKGFGEVSPWHLRMPWTCPPELKFSKC